MVKRAIETGKHTVQFNILTDPHYAKVIAACNEAVERSVRAGLDREVKKSSVLSLEEEKLILDQKICQIDTPTGLNYRMGFFCLRNFFIRGQKELRNVNIEDFQIVNLPIGQALRFTQGHSKNYRFSLARAGIGYYFYIQAARVKEAKGMEEVEGTSPPTLSYTETVFSAISRMADALVPQQDEMRQTGHKDEKSYAKYIQNLSGVKDRAAQRIISGEVENNQLLS
ncbi:hypothetical protein R1sor_003333 [Riccia sorocarpa]|uniref:Uncharacterized protein n=1 Tax=Riccia sorocarpa TaxID=122646 RepID=A0ABD3H2Y2_9MARC